VKSINEINIVSTEHIYTMNCFFYINKMNLIDWSSPRCYSREYVASAHPTRECRIVEDSVVGCRWKARFEDQSRPIVGERTAWWE
jgi:hypothetical protein